MAVAFKSVLGEIGNVTSGTTIVLTTSAAIAVGDFVIVRASADNLSATTPTFTCSDSATGGSNTYTTHIQRATNATAAAGVAGAIMATVAVRPVPAGGTITVTLSGAVTAKSMFARSFTGVLNTLRNAAVSAAGASTAAAVTSGSASIGDLVCGAVAAETRSTPTGDSDTTGGTWAAMEFTPAATGGSDAVRTIVTGQYKIATAAGTQTYNNTTANTDWVALVAIFQAAPDPAVTQAAYQWFGEGTETGATALAAQDTAVVGQTAHGDATGTLRVRLQSTTAVDVPTADDWQLQYEKNTSGSWVNITPSSLAVQTYDSPNLTGTSATTNRLTGGTGGFTAGEVSEDGTANDKGWAGNGFTEFVYALKIKAADVVDGDALRFRVLRNGATATMTYSVTPTITIKGPVALAASSGGVSTTSATLSVALAVAPVVSQAAYRFYAEGGPFDSTPLEAQDTAITANLLAGNFPLQLRTRLQETAGGTISNIAYWQLQWQKNGGPWFAALAPTQVLADSYPTSNWAGPGIGSLATGTMHGQTFLGNGQRLSRFKIYLSKNGAATGTLVAYLHAHTGTFGVDGQPTGSPLATSTNTIDMASVTSATAFQTFDFDGSVTLDNGVPYCLSIVLNYTFSDPSNCIVYKYDNSTPTHAGNRTTRTPAGVWSAVVTDDSIFEVYTETGTGVVAYDSPNLVHDTSAGPMRLTGGTGTPVTGPVTETGFVAPWGWSLNSYTEILYSIRLMADLANGDVITFRVAETSMATEMAYPVTPTINISKVSGPGPVALAGSTSGISTATGTTLARAVPLVGSAAASSTTTAALRRAVSLVGTAGGITSTTGTQQIIARALAGSSTATSTITGTLSTAGAALPSGTRALEDGSQRVTEGGEARALEAEMPFPMTGLAGWWDADDASTFTYFNGPGLLGVGGVSRWFDKSGTDHHARGDPGGSNKPTRNATINGRTALNIVPGSAGLPYTCPNLYIDGFASAYTEAEIFLVLDLEFEASTAFIYGWGTTSLWSHYPDNGTIYETWGTTVRKVVGNPTAELTAPHIYNLRTAAGLYEGAVNGQELPSITDNVVFFPSTPYQIPFHGNPATGQIGEIIMYDRVLSPAERTQVRAYLTAKWLTAPPVIQQIEGSSSGVSTAGGTTLGFVRPLVATAGGSSTATATTLVKSVPLAGTSGGLSTATATTAAVSRFFVGMTGGTSTTTAAVAVARALVGTSTGLSSDTGAASITRGLLATAGGTSTAVGDLTVLKAGVGFSGLATGTSTATGTLVAAVALAGTSTASSTATLAAPSVARALVGTSTATSTATATGLARIVMLGTASAGGSSTTTAAMATADALVGSATGASSASATLIAARALTAPAVTGTSSATGSLARAVPLVASATGGSTATATMATADALVGSAGGTSTATGNLVVARALVASTTGTSTTTGNMVASAAGGLSALVIGTSTATGSLRVARALAGSTSGLSGATGTVAKTVQMIASYTGGSTITSGTTLSVALRLVGSSSGASATTGSLIKAVALAGTSGGLSTATGALARSVPLAGGSVAGTSTATAAVRVARGLSGSSSGLSTASGAVRSVLALSASSVGFSTADASTFSLIVGLAGSTDGLTVIGGNLTAIQIVKLYGMWNEQIFEDMQYGDKQVVDWMLTPP